MPRGRITSLTVCLTDEERRTLKAWLRATTIRAGYAKRGRIVLLLADGVPIVRIAAIVGTTPRGVYKWVRRFLQYRIEGLIEQQGRWRRVTRQDRTSSL